MKYIKEHHQGISVVLSFALIPLSGFATDIYIPSLPSMAGHLQVSNAAVQLSLVIFMVSAGLSQLFVGSLLDTYGRYRPGLIAMLVFVLASFGIALLHSIIPIYMLRIVQGITVAIIVVGKRAYFIDRFSGEKLKQYTSLFSIIWATAPIIAPFLGGYLQAAFGWASNFYFLGIFTLVILIFEAIYGGESIPELQHFNLKAVSLVYSSMLRTTDYSLGLLMMALSYSMLVVYGMASPFIIEHVYHYSPVVTGYCSLFSGLALMIGGIISRALLKQPLITKVMVAVLAQTAFAGVMLVLSGYIENIYMMMGFTLLIHLASGFVFNNIFSYCLGRFSQHAGMASGITGGGMYVTTSVLSYGMVNIIAIKSQYLLAIAYLCFALLLGLVFLLFRRATLNLVAEPGAGIGVATEQRNQSNPKYKHI